MTNICSHLPLVDGALGGEVVSPGGLHGRLIHGNHGAVGVGNQSEGTGAKAVAGTVAVTGTIAGTVTEAGTVAVAGTVGDRGSSVDTSNSGEVVSTGSSHSGLVNGNHGAVRVGNQVGVQVEGAGIAIASSIGGSSGSVGGSSESHGTSSQEGAGTKLGGQVVGLQGSHTRLIDGGDGPVGVRLQAEEALGGREGEGGGENLQKAG